MGQGSCSSGIRSRRCTVATSRHPDVDFADVFAADVDHGFL